MKKIFNILLVVSLFISCNSNQYSDSNITKKLPFTWNNATIYFLMTDRFYNGDLTNDYKHTIDNPPAPLSGFMGGDIKGVTKKIRDGYFFDLGVTAIAITPLVQQIAGSVDEGTGNTFGFHGYWARDWTALDSNFGTSEDLKEMIVAAHEKEIRVLFDIVLNNTGPVTEIDSKWPKEWTREGPKCSNISAETTINCTLNDLPDIRTEYEVEIPPFLIEKWKLEGRYEQEVIELDEWFNKTGYKRTAINFILKWLVDFVEDYGIDGYRVENIEHSESFVWERLWESAQMAHKKWKKENSENILDDNDFYLVGDVDGFALESGRIFDYGDKQIDFFDLGFHCLINDNFKMDANSSYEDLFAKYDSILMSDFKGKSLINYVSSHDDIVPFDLERNKPIEAGTKLLLSPGTVQIYYGDESARSLVSEANDVASLRSFMNWDELRTMTRKNGITVNDVLIHWQKLGHFRKRHPAIGAGKHVKVSDFPYMFTRSWTAPNGAKDHVLIGLNMPKGNMVIDVSALANDGDSVQDTYSGITKVVVDGKIKIDSMFDIVLLEKVN